MDTSSVEVQRVASPKDRKAFVMLPWKVYRGDRNWVPPLISEALKQISPEHNPFFQRAEVELFLARRGRKVVGTIAVYVDPYRLQMIGEQEANFGFFEVLEDYEAAQALLDTAREWATARGMEHLVGPYNFNESDRPGVLIAGADCPPVILAGHTPPYYRDFLERYGFQKHHDVYAWRAFREQIGEEMRNLPPALLEVAEEARRREEVTLRKVDLDRWDEEIAVAHRLFTETLKGMHYYAPVPREDFERLARSMRPLLDPELIVFAEVDGEAVGFAGAIPDPNRVLIHLNGRLFPFGWAKMLWYARRIDVVTFKLMGVLPAYRRRGIDALLYLEVIRAVYERGYKWLDGSVTSEFNTIVNYLAGRLGAERYKTYRIYTLPLKD